ncbi:MAG: enoyl-CoA hydratase-related protein [Pseudomonadota bacterium]|nr:enoyl-CoA hydratase-related protein [Pseudomonadota bacterium]
MADPETISLSIDDGIATLTLDRPERLNAITKEMGEELLAAFDYIDRNDDIRAVIVTGSGRAFCAGADLGEGTATFDYGKPQPDLGGSISLRVFDSRKPVIGAINGPAIGFGSTFTLPMDVRIAAEDARFGFVFTRLGIVPEAASSWFLPRIVGIATALDWTLSGRIFGAAEALQHGLVRSLHTAEELLPEARRIVRQLTEASAPVSVAITRRMCWDMLGAHNPRQAHERDSAAMHTRGVSADAAEGISAFMQRRAARFPDLVSDHLDDALPTTRGA